MKNTLISDIMSREPISVKPDTSLLECARKMVRKRRGGLLITDKGMLHGIITTQDILWALIKKSREDLSKIRAIDVSPRKVATIRPNATIEEAFNKMKRTKFWRLPVVKDNELVGLITIKDIFVFHPGIFPEIDEFAQIKEEQEKLINLGNKSEEIVETGICEECGNQNPLQRFNGMLICGNCMNSL